MKHKDKAREISTKTAIKEFTKLLERLEWASKECDKMLTPLKPQPKQQPNKQ